MRQTHIEADLVAEKAGVRAGTHVQVGIHLKIDSGWHTYWRNPGDSGEPININWSLPAGVQSGPLLWPVPKRIATGPLVNFGYEDEVLLPMELSVPASASGELPLEASVSWVVCQQECIPGRATLKLILPVVAAEPAATRWQDAFQKARDRLPVVTKEWKAEGHVGTNEIQIDLIGPTETVQSAIYFPYSDNVLRNAEPQRIVPRSGGFSLILAKSARFVTGRNSLDGIVDLPGQNPRVIEIAPRIGAGGNAGATILQALFFAFLGGMILNLMPCVFPVLFIKILNFVELAGASRRKAMQYSLAYGAGILASFWALAAVLLALRAAGEQLGWGFQLQSPIFLALLCFLLLAMALNLMGIFEIGTSWMGVGQGLTARSGYAGSFFSGVLATVVATPCTAPFMGTAMGYALVHSAPVSLAVFSALAVGLAFPYLLLSAFPGLTKRMPRPGAWMVTFKQLMSFPLLATVVWLVSVLGLQTDLLQVVRVLGAMLVLALGLWIYGKHSRHPRLKTLVATTIAIVAIWGGIKGLKGTNAKALVVTTAVASDGEKWEEFSEANLSKALSSGRSVFIDFTAAWCITCQVNEKLVLDTAAVKEKFVEKKVFLMRADWTNQNDEISKRLQSYGRDGVPLYVLYKAGQPNDPRILPQLLTPQGMISELNRL